MSLSTTVMEEARQLDSAFRATSTFVGPLHGIPVIVKDQIDTAGLRTTYGSVTAQENIPQKDAEVVRRLREAGALVLAKATLPDWASSFYSTSSISGTTRNPYDLVRDPGGSSSGTAAAIAASLGVIGLGGDTMGSIRLPCSWCGLVGLKCTPGVVDGRGISPLLSKYDSAGPMTRTVRDAAITMDVIANRSPECGSYAAHLDVASLKKARLGVLVSAFGDDADPSCNAVNEVIRKALQVVQHSGCVLIPLSLPHLVNSINLTPGLYANSRVDLDKFMADRPALANMSFTQLVSEQRFHPSCELLPTIASPSSTTNHETRDIAETATLREIILDVLRKENLDALVFPDVQIPAVTRKEALAATFKTLQLPTNTFLAAQAMLPAISVPAGTTPAGLPVGLEIMGRPLGEQRLLDLAYGFEDMVKGRVPPQL
ncbi:Glutamyl-tRNA(Gln) amidotransferase subunit A [Exophiala dermatitidis]